MRVEGEKYTAGVKLVETVIFVPTTPNSDLRKLLQKADDPSLANTVSCLIS